MDTFNQMSEEDFNYYVEEEILDEAYYNAYLILTNKTTLKELLKSKGEIVFIPYDPEVPETVELIIDDIIEYFSSIEDYEICAELVKVKEKLNDT